MSISASCRKLWQQASHQHLWEIPNYISSQMHIKHHLLSTATNSNKRFTSERPLTKHTLLYARKPPSFHLSSPFCSLSLSLCELAFQSRESGGTTCSKRKPAHCPETREEMGGRTRRIRKRYSW